MRAYLALFCGLSFMSFSAVLIRSANAPGIATAFYRMGIASAVLLIPFLLHRITSKQSLSLKGIILAVLAGVCFGLDMALWSTGIVASNATIPTVFANTAAIWVGFGSMIFFREKHKTGFWIGLLLAFSGVPLMLGKDLYASNGIVFGALLGSAAGLFYGTFQLISQPGRKLVDTLSYLFISTFSSTMVLLALMIILRYPFTGYDRNTVTIFIVYAIGVQVTGWFLVNFSQGHLPASIVAPTLLGQPLVTAFLAIILLHEHLTIWHITGGLVIISGIYLIHFTRMRSGSRH